MYKVLGTAGFIILMLYKLFGVKAFLIILSILLILLALIFKNQNKILYIPRTYPSTKSFLMLRNHPPEILLGGDTLQNKVYPQRMLRSKRLTTLI